MSDRSLARFNLLRTAPNLLTLLRICVAPFLIAAILENHYALSFALFVAAGMGATNPIELDATRRANS